jgi:hypothetical protein
MDPKQQLTSPLTQDNNQDQALINMLEGVLSNFRQEITADVHAQIGQLKQEFSQVSQAKQEKESDKSPAKEKSLDPATKALQDELTALKSQLKKERMAKELGSIAQKYEAYPDLLELKMSQEDIVEHEGQFFVQSKDGQTKSLDNFVEQLIKSEDGSRFVQQKRANVKFNSGQESHQKEFDVANVLFNAI